MVPVAKPSSTSTISVTVLGQRVSNVCDLGLLGLCPCDRGGAVAALIGPGEGRFRGAMERCFAHCSLRIRSQYLDVVNSPKSKDRSQRWSKSIGRRSGLLEAAD